MLRVLLFIAALLGPLLVSCGSPAHSAEPAQRGKYLRWGYYVPDDPTSLASLRQRSGDLDYVGLHWATMRNDGSLEMKATSEVIQLVRSLGAKPLLSVALAGGAEGGHAVLGSDQTRATAIDSLVSAMADYEGVSIDFEGLYGDDRASLTQFMAQLAARLRPAGKLVTMALSAKTSDLRIGWAGAMDYAALAPHADLFVLMAYGYTTARSAIPGPTAPMSWVEASLAFAVSQIPPEKILLGVPLYGYDWDTTAGPPGRALRYPDAIAIADQQGATVQHDTTLHSARLTYTKDGHAHEVWFEDRTSLEAKLTLSTRYGLAGVAAWRLGHEDPGVWKAINGMNDSVRSSDGRSASSGDNGRSWYFAEGSTSPPFDSWFLLQNPNPAPANVRITFMLENGGAVARDLWIGPISRTSVFANQVIPNAAFSTRIEADQPIFAERSTYVGFDGHAVTAATEPSRTWYFADGASTAPFHTWILLQNPNAAATTARINFLREDGTTTIHSMWLPPNSRASLFANQVVPNAAFSTRVDSDQPLIAERAMYRFPGNAATGVVGAIAPSPRWYFAGALPSSRNAPVDSWLLLQNPNPAPVTATITFLGTEGQPSTVQRWLPPTSRQSFFVSRLFSESSFGIQVEATGAVIAEKSVFIGPSAASGNQLQGAYATQGAPRLGTVWMLPEGSTAPPFGEKIGVLNPHSSPMSVRFEFMQENGQVVVHNATIPPVRNLDLEVESVVKSAGVSTRVTTGLPSAVERTMFWVKEGKMGAHNTVGIRVE